jgi:hypothetical protein
LSFDALELNLQYVARNDDRPSFTAAKAGRRTEGAFGELIYTPEGDKSMWYGVLLYNWVKSEAAGLNYSSASVHGGYLVGRNLRLMGEYTYDIEQKANRFTVGFVSAF